MNYFPFHIGDYLSDTRHLSWDEDAAYRRLLDTYYTTESPLPVERRAIYRLVLASTDVQREAVNTVLDEFFELTENGWVNHRAATEIEAMREKQQKQRDKANKRWHKQEPEPGIASAVPQHDSDNATASDKDADAMPPTPTPTPTPNIKPPSPARTTSPVDKFSISDDWQPSENFPTSMVMAGLDPETHLTVATLAEFVSYWSSRDSPPLQTQSQWDHKFLQALIKTKNHRGANYANGSSGTGKLTSHERVQRANQNAYGPSAGSAIEGEFTRA